MNLCIFLLILIYVNIAYSATSSCHQHKTCGDCIQNKIEICNWCSEEKDVSPFRCQPKSYNDKNADWCKEDQVFPPKKQEKARIVVANNISSTVQIYPQQVEIITTPGVETTFDLKYRPKTDFPLDVYFLLDYSGTMNKHREMLKNQSLEIFTSLSNLTNNVILGVGGFVEKPGWPYTDVKKNGNNTYAFRNYLNLTSDKDAFKNAIDGFPVGTNYDDAEAGLDALMQVMVCKVGWRTDTRRIIVLATDNTYHSAGDGKMLGAVQPNDMQCHWENNEYKREDSLKYDYPSVSQISKIARENNFLIIFAALEYMKPKYTDLKKQIIGSDYAVLNDKDSTIMNIIKKAYKESLSKGIITHDPSKNFEIKIDQECNASPERNCFITVNRPELTIPVTITGKICTSKLEKISISPVGLDEKLRLSVKVNCHCDCKNKKGSTRKSCNNNGIIECGACKCDKNWGGDTCSVRCDDKTSELLKTHCHPEQNLTRPECSGHGSCECGKCKCTNLFTGNVCEFDPNSCNTGSNGKICSGDERGVCQYGECHCKGVWGGAACDCPTEKESIKRCTGPFSTEVCSGRGNCTCGKCSCDEVKNSGDRYTGPYCDFCKDCRNEVCQKFEGYAKCNHNKTKNICDKEFKITTEENLFVLVEKKIDLINNDEWKIGTLCRSYYDDGSSLLFKYHFSNGNTLIMIQKEIEKPVKADLLIPIASAIAGILLIGLLTVVFWKVLIEWYDKREYNKFCDEAKAQGFDVSQNPLYEPPTQNFVNPGFNQNI